jgi:hypothetical protein
LREHASLVAKAERRNQKTIAGAEVSVMILRSILSFFSVLAVGAMTAAALVALLPSFAGHAPAGLQAAADGLQLESLLAGMALGLTLGTIGRYNWADIPRRIVTWFLVRERQFFYYSLIAICAVVLFFY